MTWDESAICFVFALLVCLAIGGPCIEWLRKIGAKQTVSADAPERHSTKQGTPTMGGLIILAGFGTGLGIHMLLRKEHAALDGVIFFAAASFGAIGFLDDLLIARRGKNLGLRAREKLALQFVAAAIFVAGMRAIAPTVPFPLEHPGEPFGIRLGAIGGGALFVVGMVAFANAVNFADGLDGLAAGLLAVMAGAAATGLLAQHPLFGALAGACLGFLWFNGHPARVFMGDTGSLALGGAAAAIALTTGSPWQRFLIGSLPVWAILGSVIIQVSVFKARRWRHGLEYARSHRVFRRTPLHHHFEELGLPETRIVTRFWIVTAVCCAVAAI